MALLNPYINFGGNAREAMEYYKSVFGGKLDISTFADFQMPGIAEDEADKVMHSQLATDSGFTLMGSDLPSSMGTSRRQQHDRLDQRQRGPTRSAATGTDWPTAGRSACH